LTCPVKPPMTTTATPAQTPIAVRQYAQEGLSGRLRTLAAYRAVLTITFELRRSGQRARAELLEHFGDQRGNR
jgi:hypothetical protein